MVFVLFSRKVVVLQKKDEEAFGFEIQVRRALPHRPKHERFYAGISSSEGLGGLGGGSQLQLVP